MTLSSHYVKYSPEKCREQRMPLYITFIDLTKAFDLVNRRGLLEILKRIGCPAPRLLNIMVSFHEHTHTHNIVSFKGTTSEAFPGSSGVKQGCLLAPTLSTNLLLTASPVCVQRLRLLISKDLLYGKLTEGSRPVGRPRLRYIDICKRDMNLK